MENQPGPTTKEKPAVPNARKPSIEDCAAQIRECLGKSGGPIAEALLIVAAQVEANKADLHNQVVVDTNEMRGYAHGARASAGKAAASAEETRVSVAALQEEYAAFLSELETAGGALATSAANAEASAIHAQSSLETIQRQTTPLISAIESLTDGEAKGVEALQQILGSVANIPDAIRAAVEEIIFIDVKTSTADGVETPKRLVGSDAMRYFRYGLSYVSQTAGEAIKAANDAKSEVAALVSSVGNLDAKLSFIMYRLIEGGADFSQDEVASMEKPSYNSPKTKPAVPKETASTETTDNQAAPDGPVESTTTQGDTDG